MISGLLANQEVITIQRPYRPWDNGATCVDTSRDIRLLIAEDVLTRARRIRQEAYDAMTAITSEYETAVLAESDAIDAVLEARAALKVAP